MKISQYGFRLQTRRTRIRQLSQDDIPFLLKLHQDKDTQKFSWIDNLHDERAISDWIYSENNKTASGYGIMAIESIRDFCLIGVCGLRFRPDLENRTDISFRIIPEKRNQGFASEVVAEFVNFGFNSLKLNEILAEVHEKNYPSRRIMYRMQFNRVHRESCHHPWMLFRKLSSYSKFNQAFT